MAIGASSTLAEVFASGAAKWGPSADDIKAWAKANPAKDDTDTVTNIGVFGGDLTTFLADCATATTNCKAANYDGYNGWGVGINWTKGTTSQATGEFDAVLFTSIDQVVENKIDTTTNVLTVYTVASAYVPAATYADADTTAVKDGSADPFAAWYAAGAKVDAAQLIISFIEEGDADFDFQVGDVEDIWVYKPTGTGTGAGGVKTADFEFAGAAQLATAAATFAVALLF